MAKEPNATKVVGLLIEVANADTVYRDFYPQAGAPTAERRLG